MAKKQLLWLGKPLETSQTLQNLSSGPQNRNLLLYNSPSCRAPWPRLLSQSQSLSKLFLSLLCAPSPILLVSIATILIRVSDHVTCSFIFLLIILYHIHACKYTYMYVYSHTCKCTHMYVYVLRTSMHIFRYIYRYIYSDITSLHSLGFTLHPIIQEPSSLSSCAPPFINFSLSPPLPEQPAPAPLSAYLGVFLSFSLLFLYPIYWGDHRIFLSD